MNDSGAVRMRDMTRQREALVPTESGMLVRDVLESGLRQMGLPQMNQAGMPLEYSIRTAEGHLVRPSEALSGEIQDQLSAGECTVVPRLTAAIGP